jgi:beta-N-acetylhexosaminidase
LGKRAFSDSLLETAPCYRVTKTDWLEKVMDLKEELGNLFIIGFPGPAPPANSWIARAISEKSLGGVILFDHCLHTPELSGNITSPQQLRQLTTLLRGYGNDELLICVDQEGGLVQRLNHRNGFTATASAADMGNNNSFTRTEAEQTARTLSSAGITINFAPVIDLNTNKTNPIIGKIGRSFSEDPTTVVEHASVWIEAHNKHGIISCLKHFPGHGSSTSDSHLGFVDITSSWQEQELFPFRELISRGAADLVMAGHLFNRNIDPKFPATLSHATITDLLRDKLGFTGVVLTDDMQMKGISDRYHLSEALCHSFAAGIDLIVIGNNLVYDPAVLDHAIEAVLHGLHQGIVTEEHLYSALDRVKKLKTLVKEKQHERTACNT